MEEEKNTDLGLGDLSIADMGLEISSREIEGEDHVLISVQPPAGVRRTPVDVCCVVDISGSMGEEATIRTESGSVESHGLSLLDIVKHAVKSIAASLQQQDRLAIVVYSTEAEKLVQLAPMTPQATREAFEKLDGLAPDDDTNLWAGLLLGLELLEGERDESRARALMLLTDGLPNRSPPGGELAALRRYKDQNRLCCAVSTFGFGYKINSGLLKDIAVEGNGMYSFIPESSFVGTAFVNGISNLLVTAAKDVILSLEPLNGARISGVLGSCAHQVTDWGVMISLGSLQYDQTRDVVIKMELPKDDRPYVRATLKYQTATSSRISEISVESSQRNGDDRVNLHRFRLLFVDYVRQAMDKMKNNEANESQNIIKKLIAEMQSSNDKHVAAMLEDLTGQVMQAFGRADWYKKWGNHYLPSLMHAHLLQQCNNFKDPGIQHYGGNLFRSLRDEVDDLFCKLPAPKPSIKHSEPKYTAPVNMSMYNASSAPCFDGECLVTMKDDSQKKLKDIIKSDQVKTPNGKSAQIVCVVKTICSGNKAELVELQGNLLVTPYHPVRIDGVWRFPCDFAKPTERFCPAVYSFVLTESHVMIINGIECISLGHDFKDDSVASHPYFGSQRVINDLQKIGNWENGIIELYSGCMIRDKETGLICGIIGQGA